MSTVSATTTRRIDAPAERVLAALADYRGTRPRLLPEQFTDYEVVEGGETRTVLKLHPRLAPVKVAVFPLLRKDGHPELAREVFSALRGTLQAECDDGGAIGKRYRRQDEIGTPWGITVDGQTLEDGTVTLRERDSLDQTRIEAGGLAEELKGRLAAPWSSPKLQ